MKKNTVAIYVATPYQLMNALNAAKNYLKADECVLFLTEDYFRTDRKFHIKSTHPFISAIYYTQDYTEVGALRHHLLRIKGFFKGYRSKDYPNMCCYYRTKPKKMPYFSAIVCNKYDVKLAKQYITILKREAEVYVIEDGLGDYTLPPKPIDSSFHRLFYWSDLFTEMHNEKAIQLPKLSPYDAELKEIFGNIFPLTPEDIQIIEKCKCVYFHQPQDIDIDEEKAKAIKNREKQILSILHNKFGDEFFIKLHPRDDLSLYPEYQHIKSSIPWEAMIFYKNNASKLVLVGSHSTTLFTPKSTFDFEPYTIILARVNNIEGTEVKSNDEKVFSKLSEEYSDSSKLCIPNSLDEFSRFVESI